MGRPEVPLNPADGPIAAFACDLRALRERAGNPSYRVLARRTHYSVTTLSQAAAGKVLPTMPVLTAFVAGCAGDVAQWQARWRALAGELSRSAPDADADDGGAGRPEDGPAVRPGRRLWGGRLWGGRLWGGRRSAIRTSALAAVILVAAVGGWLVASGPGRPSSTAGTHAHAVAAHSVTPSPVIAPGSSLSGGAAPIADGSDPGLAGCGPDAITLLSTNVILRGQLAGLLELRYSPYCRAAWSRFTPTTAWSPGPGLMVTVWTVRPVDHATQQYTVPYGGEVIIGNILLTAQGCVLAGVTMRQDQLTSPFATTACQVVTPSVVASASAAASATPSG